MRDTCSTCPGRCIDVDRLCNTKGAVENGTYTISSSARERRLCAYAKMFPVTERQSVRHCHHPRQPSHGRSPHAAPFVFTSAAVS
eukprot:137238-Pleurochrysis_carterae.AAC.1